MLRSDQRKRGIFQALMAKLHLITYGCQMNEYDSERVAGLLREERWELTPDETEADLILVNTCAIREKAEDKVFSKLGELRLLKTQKPELIIGVMGCMAQLHQKAIQRRAPSVDLVFGSPAIARVAELVDRVRRERRPAGQDHHAPAGLGAAQGIRHGHGRVREALHLLRRAAHARARAQPSARGHRRRGPPARGRGLPRGDPARPDGERLWARPHA